MIEFLQDPAYRHMLLNHIPLIGLAIALLVLLAGLLLKQAAVMYLGLALTLASSAIALPVALAGDAAYTEIYDGLGGDGRDWLDYHVYLAERLLPLIYANAVLALVALVVGILRSAWLSPAVALIALVSCASVAGTVLVAEAGGKIKHPEFRWRDAPVIQRSD